DPPLRGRLQLNLVAASAGGLAHEAHAVVHTRRPEVRDVRLLAAAAERDTREADDVGLPGSDRQQARGVAADEDRRARALDGARVDRVPGHAIVLSGGGDRFALEQALDDDERLRQPLDAGSAGVEAESRCLVLRLDLPRSAT